MKSSLTKALQFDFLESFEVKDDVFLHNAVEGISSSNMLTLINRLLSFFNDNLVLKLKESSVNPDIDEQAFQLSRLVYQLTVATKHRPQGYLKLLSQCSHLLDILDRESASLAQFKDIISQTLEYLYLSKETGADEFVPDILKFLVLESLKVGAKEALIKRLYNVRQGFQVIDLHHEGSQWIRNLLLRTFANPLYLRHSEGINFLVFILVQFSDLFLSNVSNVLRNNIASLGSAKDLAKSYGLLLQKTLTMCHKLNNNNSNNVVNKEVLKAVEELVQNFLHDAVYAADGRYFSGMRLLLKTLHDTQRPVWFEDLLVRVFDPIIWRAMKCANALVRAQAAYMFLDVFPLQKQAQSSSEESDVMIQKQFDQLAQLLKDGDHKVRSLATRGICVILREYWDALPLATIVCLLRFVCDTLALDTSSGEVRVSVMLGLKELLKQPLAHSTLKNVLPLLASSIFDKSERVRLEFINILINVKGIRDMHFYDIVPVEMLFSRLVHERRQPQITAAICDLLLNSFFPCNNNNKESVGQEHVQRCLQLISQKIVAAEIFYNHLPQLLPSGVLAKFVALLGNRLCHATHKLQVCRQALSLFDAQDTSDKNNRKKVMKRNRNGSEHANTSASRTSSHEDMLLEREEQNEEIFGLLRVISAIVRGGFDLFALEAPSVSLMLRFVTPARLSAAVDATAETTNEGLVDEDVCLCVVELSSTLSQLSTLTQTPVESGLIWCETFSLTFAEHVLSQMVAASRGVSEVNKEVLQQQFAQKCVALLVTCREHTHIVASLLTLFASAEENLCVGDASVFQVRCVLLQALCHFCLKDMPAYLEDNQLKMSFKKLQQQYFFWRNSKLTEKQYKSKDAAVSQSAIQLLLWRRCFAMLFKSFALLAVSETAAFLNTFAAGKTETVLDENEMATAFAPVDAVVTHLIHCISTTSHSIKRPNKNIATQVTNVSRHFTQQECVLLTLSLLDLAHIVDERFAFVVLRRVLQVFDAIENHQTFAQDKNGFVSLQQQALLFCLQRTNEVLSALQQQQSQEENTLSYVMTKSLTHCVTRLSDAYKGSQLSNSDALSDLDD